MLMLLKLFETFLSSPKIELDKALVPGFDKGI